MTRDEAKKMMHMIETIHRDDPEFWEMVEDMASQPLEEIERQAAAYFKGPNTLEMVIASVVEDFQQGVRKRSSLLSSTSLH